MFRALYLMTKVTSLSALIYKHRSKKKLPRFAGKLFLCQILCMVILAIFVLVLQSGQYRIVAQRKSVVHENICSRDQS